MKMTLYECDTEKNDVCAKTSCGLCHMTHERKYAKLDENVEPIVGDVINVEGGKHD